MNQQQGGFGGAGAGGEWPIGAHLVTPRRGYTHHGIYAGGGRVIHYAGFSRTWWRGPVEEVSLQVFRLGRPVAMRDFSNARHWGVARVERARQRLGENRFSIWSNNCEHFCNWCAHGASQSAQVEALRERLVAIVSMINESTTMILRKLFIALAALLALTAPVVARAEAQAPDALVNQVSGDPAQRGPARREVSLTPRWTCSASPPS